MLDLVRMATGEKRIGFMRVGNGTPRRAIPQSPPQVCRSSRAAYCEAAVQLVREMPDLVRHDGIGMRFQIKFSMTIGEIAGRARNDGKG